MLEMEVRTVLPKTEEEIQEEQRRQKLKEQLKVHHRLVAKAKDSLSQAEKVLADTRVRRAQAKAQADGLALQAELDEERTKRKQQEKLLQQMGVQLEEALGSVNGAHSQPNSDSQLAHELFCLSFSEVITVSRLPILSRTAPSIIPFILTSFRSG
jgi:hypothetical protein